ncbi:MAG: Clp protease N-terminal domain-containing protein [Thermoleophilia bacterium]
MGRLLEAAEAVARRDGAEQPGPEHLLLAALDLPDGSARRALGLDPAEDPGPQPLPPRRRPGTTRSAANAQRLFQAATRRCHADRVPLAGAHVLLARRSRSKARPPARWRRQGWTGTPCAAPRSRSSTSPGPDDP